MSRLAIEQLFTDLHLIPTRSQAGAFDSYTAKNIEILIGDIFDLSSEILGQVDAVYDRAALVALPEKMRRQYAAHLLAIARNAPQLLLCYEYDQRLQEGPPFSIGNEEVHQLYGTAYTLTLKAGYDVPGGLKGKCTAKENVWLLTKK